MEGQPKNLDEAIETLKDFYGPDLVAAISEMSESEFSASAHMQAGMFIRNSWYLWWYADHIYPNDWPAEKPPIVQFFNDMDIYHADDMSGIILTSTYRNIKGVPIDLEGQLQVYREHWKQYGYPDGIYKPKK